MRKSFDGLFGIIKSDLKREPVVAPSGLKPNSREQARGDRREGTAKQPENFGAIISRYQMITMQATEVLRFQLRQRCELQKSCGRAQERVGHREPARRDPQCELDVACLPVPYTRSRRSDVFKECHNAHAPRDG